MGGAAFDFSSFAGLHPGQGDAQALAQQQAELDDLDAADDDTLRQLVEQAQGAAEAVAQAEVAANVEKLAQLDKSRGELEVELSAARQAADRAPDAAAGDAERSRVRRLTHCLDANARQRAAVACKGIFKASDGFKAAFGGGGVLVGLGDMVDDSVEVGVHVTMETQAPAQGQPGGSASLRVRVGAPGPVGSDGTHPPGGARAVVRLSKLGVRGDKGVPGVVNINSDGVTLNVEFVLHFSVTYKTTGSGHRAWVSDGVHLDIHRLEQKTSGLVLADTGLPLLEMPEGLLRLVLSLVIPRAVEESLAAQLPAELGEYLLASGQGVDVCGAMTTRGAPLAVLDANMCDDAAPAASTARQLASLAGAKAAEVLAQALTDWKQLGLSMGPDARKHLLLGLPAGDAGVERGRVSLGDLQRYAHRIAAWGPRAEKAFGLLWDRALAPQATEQVHAIRVSSALQAARALGRRPVRGVLILHSVRGGVNVHAAARASAAVESKRGAPAGGAGEESPWAVLLSNLDAVAANITKSTATVAMRMAGGQLQLEASRVRHEGPVSVWTTLPLLRRGVLDLRRTTSRRPHPPLPLVLRAAVETRAAEVQPTATAEAPPASPPDAVADSAQAVEAAPAASVDADTAPQEAPAEAATEDVVRLDVFCPSDMCAPFGEADAGLAPSAVDGDSQPLTAVLAGELSGLQCGLVVDPAALMAASASAPSSDGTVPALTLHLTAAKEGVNGFDAALHAAPGVRFQASLRRAAATLHVVTAVRVACRYMAGLAQRCSSASPDPVPGAAPSAALLRILERFVSGVQFTSVVTATASVNTKGELVLSADTHGPGSQGDPGAPVVVDVEFQMADIEKETQEMLVAVNALHSLRSRMTWTMPRWAKPPPVPCGQHQAPPEEDAVAGPAVPAKQPSGGFQLPFQSEVGNFFRGIPGIPK